MVTETYLERVNPQVTLDIGSDLESELSYPSKVLSVGASTTRSEASYQRRARSFLLEEASEASLREVARELDQEVELEPDGETVGTHDTTCISVSGESDLSFVSNADNFREIVDVENWRARNDAQELRLLRRQNRTSGIPEHVLARNAQAARQVIDLTDEPVAEPPSKRTRFE